MKEFGFEVSHGYKVMKCCAEANVAGEIIDAVKDGTFTDLPGFDCIDEYDTDVNTEGYCLLDMWEC